MKKGWEVKKLGEICDLVGGGTPSKSNSEYYKGNILWATVRDMKSDLITDTEFKITEQAIRGSSTNIIPKGNVIIATRVSLGKVCLTDDDTAINQDLKGIVPKSHKKILSKYLFHWFKSISDSIKENGTGATVQGVKLTFIENILIPVPSLPEQQRIVAILDEAFDAIARTKENAEKNLQNTKEIFETYLESVFANPGDGWEEKKLKEIGFTQTGTTPKTSSPENYGDFIPFVKPADIDIFGNGEIRCNSEGLSKKGLDNARKIPRCSILMVCIGASIGKVGFTDRDISCNQQINTLTVNETLNYKFFYYALRAQTFIKQVILNSSQATLPIINKSKWENLLVSFPKFFSEQESIVAKLNALSTEAKKLEAIYNQKLTDLEELKKSILQKAFNGEL